MPISTSRLWLRKSIEWHLARYLPRVAGRRFPPRRWFARIFHVKDAEFRPSGKSGVYGGYQNWIDRPGRFRSLGDGQVDFKAVFSKFAQYDYPGWAVVEWECAIKHPEDGAKEGAAFVRDHIIRVTEHAFDDFAGQGADEALNRRVLGLS